MLPEGSPVVREPLRPVEFRQPSYLKEFDAHTLFYDVFRIRRDGKSFCWGRQAMVWLENCEQIERLTVGNTLFGEKE